MLVRWAAAKDLLAGNPHLRRVYQCDFSEVGAPAFLKFLAGLRQERYDVSINTHPQSKVEYRVVARIIGATQRLSHTYDNSTFLDKLLITHNWRRTTPSIRRTTISSCCRCSAKRRSWREHEFELFLTPEEIAAAKGIADQNRLASRRVVGIHAGSGKTKNLRMKRWPVENYIALIRRLTAARPDVTVLLFGGPGEQEENARIAAEAAHPNLLIPKTRSIREAAALMKHCEVFLSVDNVMMHFAAAMKVPKQVLIEAMAFGPTLEPYGRPYRLVKNPAVHGRNLDYYRYDGKEIRGSEAELRQIMEAVKVDDVFAAITEALDRN